MSRVVSVTAHLLGDRWSAILKTVTSTASSSNVIRRVFIIYNQAFGNYTTVGYLFYKSYPLLRRDIRVTKNIFLIINIIFFYNKYASVDSFCDTAKEIADIIFEILYVNRDDGVKHPEAKLRNK